MGSSPSIPFQGGGTSPQEAAYAQYLGGQQRLGSQSFFARQGTPNSTMATQAATGANNLIAQTAANISDQNQAAASRASLQLAQTQGQGLGSLVGGIGGLIGK